MTQSSPNFGLALGGGGARGLAHIKILQVIDEFNLKPSHMSGTSMGALIGSLYAAGMSGIEIEDFAKQLFSKRTKFISQLYGNSPQNLTRLFNLMTPAVVDAVSFFELILQKALPETFEELKIPLSVVTSDFYAQSEYIITTGPLMPAIAASSALPAMLKPVELDDRILIDGGFINPVPFNILANHVDFTIAVDVTGEPGQLGSKIPNSLDALVGASQIMIRALTNSLISQQQPSILVQPMVGRYNVLDYFKMNEIFEDTQQSADQLRRDLETFLTAKA